MPKVWAMHWVDRLVAKCSRRLSGEGLPELHLQKACVSPGLMSGIRRSVYIAWGLLEMLERSAIVLKQELCAALLSCSGRDGMRSGGIGDIFLAEVVSHSLAFLLDAAQGADGSASQGQFVSCRSSFGDAQPPQARQ